MALRPYQHNILLNNLYEVRLNAPSGLGESLAPRITSVGGLLTVYGSEEEPTGLTLANLATKMVLIKDDVAMQVFESIPNYIAVVQKSGTSTELVMSCINPGDSLQVIS